MSRNSCIDYGDWLRIPSNLYYLMNCCLCFCHFIYISSYGIEDASERGTNKAQVLHSTICYPLPLSCALPVLQAYFSARVSLSLYTLHIVGFTDVSFLYLSPHGSHQLSFYNIHSTFAFDMVFSSYFQFRFCSIATAVGMILHKNSIVLLMQFLLKRHGPSSPSMIQGLL